MSRDLGEFEYGPAFDAVDIGIIVLDEERQIAGWNDWIARVFGQPKEAVAGKSFYDLFPSARTTRLPSVIDDSFEFGSSSVLTHSLNTLLPLRNDIGQELLHNIVVRPISSHHTKYCLLQINDVTVAVTRERVLRERQNARYRAIVDTAPDAIITTNEDGTIQWLNGEAEHAFGYAPAELLGRKINDLVEPNDLLLRAFSEKARDGRSSVQVVGRRKQGQPAHFDVSFSHWAADGRIFMTTIWRDVSDLVEARNALLKSNEQLEVRVAERTREHEVALGQLHEAQKMESIGQFTGGVAHDFNNLLSVILGNLALLKKNIPDDPRSARLLDGAVQGAERGASLTKRLLAFARRQELNLAAVKMQELMPEMLDFLRHTAGPEIQIVVDILPDVQPISVDANQLELAVMNLVQNARDAMPHGGTVTITCRNEIWGPGAFVPKDLPPGYYVRLTIADTGEGMDDVTRARAMEPFFTTKGVGKGTGLGLSMVQGVTAQSGGAIHIASELGAGTIVTLWLPRAQDDTMRQVPEAAARPAGDTVHRGLKVLLVDDDVLVRMGAADMLTDLGHDVVEAQSGARALQLLESGDTFDVVVTDYAMPGMSGLDLVLKIEQIDPQLPVVLATGYAELPVRAGPLRFPRLGKPYTQAQLSQVLDTAANTRISPK
jgi:PAS domain S-box-containing protein